MAFVSAHLERLCRFNSAESADFLEIVDSASELSTRLHNERKPSQTISPSSFRCDRKAWFKLRGVDPDVLKTVDNTTNWLAAIGSAAHEIIQSQLSQYLKDDWISVSDYLENHEEIKWTKEDNYEVEKNGFETRVRIKNPGIQFSVDGLVKFQDKIWLLEIKTMETSSFRDLIDPREKDLEQIRMYASLLNIHDVFILYVDRVYGDSKCFKFTVSDSVFEKIWNKIKYIQDAADFGVAPEGLDKKDIWCQECIYRKTCDQWG